MYRLYENFEKHNEYGMPYSLTEENLHQFTTPSGYSEDGRFCLLRKGARLIFNMPSVTSFTINASVGFLPPAIGYFAYAEWDIDFGYSKPGRCGKRLSIGFDTKRNILKIDVLSVKGSNYTQEQSVSFEGVSLSVDTDYPLSFKVENGKCVGSFSGYDFSFFVNAAAGKIGIASENTCNGVYFSDFLIESEENCGRLIKREAYEIPYYDGGCIPYGISLSVTEYEGAYEVFCELSGGVYSKKTPDYKMSIWSVEYDIFTNPYIKLYTKRGAVKFYLKNGTLVFVEQNETVKGPELMLGGSTMPYSESFYLDSFDTSYDFAFGYDSFRALGNELQEGKREFVYKNGKLFYSGNPLTDEYAITVKSPENKAITKKIPKDIDLYENALLHAKDNHYFLSEEDAEFSITVLSHKNSDLLSTKITLLDAFFDEIKELSFESCASETFNEYGIFSKECSVNLGKMAQGVYHLKAELLLGGETVCSHTSAFEVLDGSEKSPRESSGIPFMYSGEATPPNIEFNCPDPWIIKPDHNETHYIDCMLGVPEIIEKRRGWEELFKLYKLKTFMWVDHRTTPRDKNKLDYEKTIKLADYLKLAGPPCYALLPSIFTRDGVLDIYRRFKSEHHGYNLPEIADGCVISKEDFDSFYNAYGIEWLTYLADKNSENVIEEHEKIRKINPNVKFVQYGPYTPYSARLPGPNGPIGTVSRMISPDKAHLVMDGFWVFEDYPFITDQRTYISAWCITNNLLHLPRIKFLVELFSNFDPVCPDGAVCYAYPPMGGVYVETYRTVTQVYELLYASAFRDGAFKYYENPAFQFMQVYSTEAQGRMEELLKGYGAYLKNKPKSPERSAVFIGEYDSNDDRLNLEYSFRGANNISQSTEAYLYGLVAKTGLPKGYSTNFLGLCELDTDKIDIAVLPSLRCARENVRKKICEMSECAIPLIATSDVSGLEELFGVVRKERKITVSAVESKTERELVSEREVILNYRENGAEVIAYAISTSGERVPFIFKNGKNVLIGGDITAIGGVEFIEYPFGGANISRITEKVLTSLISELSRPLATADNECGLNLFVGEDGKKRILLTDYSPCLTKESKRITVRLNFRAENVECAMHKDMAVTPNAIKENGILKAFTVILRPGESALFTLT